MPSIAAPMEETRFRVVHLPIRSDSIRPNIFGNQKYRPADSPNCRAASITKWKWATPQRLTQELDLIGRHLPESAVPA